MLLTSKVSVLAHGDKPAEVEESELTGLAVFVAATNAQKCERCWHYCDDVGSVEAHAELCGRCVTNVDGDGETRQFA